MKSYINVGIMSYGFLDFRVFTDREISEMELEESDPVPSQLDETPYDIWVEIPYTFETSQRLQTIARQIKSNVRTEL